MFHVGSKKIHWDRTVVSCTAFVISPREYDSILFYLNTSSSTTIQCSMWEAKKSTGIEPLYPTQRLLSHLGNTIRYYFTKLKHTRESYIQLIKTPRAPAAVTENAIVFVPNCSKEQYTSHTSERNY